MEEQTNQIPWMSEETFEHMKVMYPDGAVMGTIREISGWD